jgi:hypothetical protein
VLPAVKPEAEMVIDVPTWPDDGDTVTTASAGVAGMDITSKARIIATATLRKTRLLFTGNHFFLFPTFMKGKRFYPDMGLPKL